MTERDRIAEAYIAMARQAKYRPAAPGDGVGNVDLSADELRDDGLLGKEAERYADSFIAEENTRQFFIGCTKLSTSRATVYAIEAARCMCGAANKDLILKLLRMASEEIAQKRS